jgi:hypothetical protein
MRRGPEPFGQIASASAQAQAQPSAAKHALPPCLRVRSCGLGPWLRVRECPCLCALCPVPVRMRLSVCCAAMGAVVHARLMLPTVTHAFLIASSCTSRV